MHRAPDSGPPLPPIPSPPPPPLPPAPPIGPQVPEAPAESGSLLTAFLRNRDCPCPHCGYNVRGVVAGRPSGGPADGESAACPECGRVIALALAAGGGLGGRGLFIMLALMWVFAASGMNGARLMRNNYLIAQAAAPRVMTFTSSMTTATFAGGKLTWSTTTSGPGGTQTRSGVGAPPGATGPSGGPASGPASGPGVQITTVPGGRSTSLGTLTLSPGAPGLGPRATLVGAPAPPPNWSAVGVEQWLTLGWWGLLCVLALAGLAALWVLHWRSRRLGAGAGGAISARRARLLTAWAAGVFLLYSGYHVQAFVRDAVMWW